jgi:hypothetical protein
MKKYTNTIRFLCGIINCKIKAIEIDEDEDGDLSIAIQKGKKIVSVEIYDTFISVMIAKPRTFFSKKMLKRKCFFEPVMADAATLVKNFLRW